MHLGAKPRQIDCDPAALRQVVGDQADPEGFFNIAAAW
jgi:hypothetical protein